MQTVRPKTNKSVLQRALLSVLALGAVVLGWAIVVQYRVQTAGLAQ